MIYFYHVIFKIAVQNTITVYALFTIKSPFNQELVTQGNRIRHTCNGTIECETFDWIMDTGLMT